MAEDAFEDLKARPGAAIILIGERRELVIESYEDVMARLEEAEAWVSFTGYSDFPAADKRITQQLRLRVAAIIMAEEITDGWLDAMDKEREERAKNPPPLAGMIEIGGFLDGGDPPESDD